MEHVHIRRLRYINQAPHSPYFMDESPMLPEGARTPHDTLCHMCHGVPCIHGVQSACAVESGPQEAARQKGAPSWWGTAYSLGSTMSHRCNRRWQGEARGELFKIRIEICVNAQKFAIVFQK